MNTVSTIQVVKLKDVCRIRYGKDYRRLEKGDIPCYGSGGVYAHVGQSLSAKKSVLIPRKGTLTNLFLVEPPFWAVDTIFWTEIDENLILPEFLFYSLSMKNLQSMNSGTAVPSLTSAHLYEMKITLPPISVQQSMCSCLTILDEKIKLNKTINHHLFI